MVFLWGGALIFLGRDARAARVVARQVIFQETQEEHFQGLMDGRTNPAGDKGRVLLMGRPYLAGAERGLACLPSS